MASTERSKNRWGFRIQGEPIEHCFTVLCIEFAVPSLRSRSITSAEATSSEHPFDLFGTRGAVAQAAPRARRARPSMGASLRCGS